MTSAARTAARLLLGVALVFAGTAHLTFARRDFQSQVPDWAVPEILPFDKDDIVVMSGVVEVGLGAAAIALPKESKRIGWVLAAFFVAVFPGNIAQFVERRTAFHLDTDLKRALRLPFQPLLIAWALWSTGALRK